jgi:hypothetical protein
MINFILNYVIKNMNIISKNVRDDIFYHYLIVDRKLSNSNKFNTNGTKNYSLK